MPNRKRVSPIQMFLSCQMAQPSLSVFLNDRLYIRPRRFASASTLYPLICIAQWPNPSDQQSINHLLGSLGISIYLGQVSWVTLNIWPNCLSFFASLSGLPRFLSFPSKGVFGGPTREYLGVLLGSMGVLLGTQGQYNTLTRALVVLWRCASRIMWNRNATDPIRYRSNLSQLVLKTVR